MRRVSKQKIIKDSHLFFSGMVGMFRIRKRVKGTLVDKKTIKDQ